MRVLPWSILPPFFLWLPASLNRGQASENAPNGSM